MEATVQWNGAERVWPEDSGASDLEKAIISAGCQLKRIVCSRLVGEISDSHYDAQRSRLLQQYDVLTQARGGAGYSWQASADEADSIEA